MYGIACGSVVGRLGGGSGGGVDGGGGTLAPVGSGGGRSATAHSGELVDELEELVAELGARHEVDEEIEGEVAVGEELDDGKRELVLPQSVVRVHGDDDGRQEGQEQEVHRDEHEREIARSGAHASRLGRRLDG